MTNKILENMARAIYAKRYNMLIVDCSWEDSKQSYRDTAIQQAKAALESIQRDYVLVPKGKVIIMPHNAEVLIDDVIWREKDGRYDVIRVTESKLKPEHSGHNLHSIIQRNGKQVIHEAKPEIGEDYGRN